MFFRDILLSCNFYILFHFLFSNEDLKLRFRPSIYILVPWKSKKIITFYQNSIARANKNPTKTLKQENPKTLNAFFNFLPGFLFRVVGFWVLDEKLVCGIFILLIRAENNGREEGILRGKDIFLVYRWVGRVSKKYFLFFLGSINGLFFIFFPLKGINVYSSFFFFCE